MGEVSQVHDACEERCPNQSELCLGGWSIPGAYLCNKLSDCPTELASTAPGTTRLAGCDRARDLPAGVKECRYVER